MFFIGIDIAKSTHFASVVNSDCDVIIEPFNFTNDEVGFNLFLSKINHFNIKDILIGLEATGVYGDNLISFLFNKGFSIGKINPIQTDSLRSSNIRKTKNDKIDTFLIAKCLMLKQYSLVTYKDISVIELRSFCRFKLDLIKSQTKLKIQLISCLDVVFPEVQYFFGGKFHIKTSYSLLSIFSTAKEISTARIDKLTNIMNSASRGRFKRDKALALKELAKHSVGMHNTAISLQIKMIIEQIQMLKQQIDLLDNKISNTMNTINSPIISIPGIGVWLGAIIISEIGNISKFSNPSKLLAFAGLDPSVRQSGNFNATNTKISKRGSKHLRYAINMAASLIIWNNETFHIYYTSKLAQGKSHLNAIGHVSHKLTRIIFKLLTTDSTFNLS